MGNKKWSNKEKKLVVMELLRGQKSVSQLSKERGMSDALIYHWRDQALKAVGEGLSGTNGGVSERERLLKIIGEQACVIDTLKKISEIS